MTPERKAELRALCEAATRGPWCWINSNWSDGGDGFFRAGRLFGDSDLVADVTNGGFVYTTRANAQFIVAARTAIPELLDRIEALEAALKAMVDQEVEYMTINNLGDPEQQHNIIRARAVLEGKP